MALPVFLIPFFNFLGPIVPFFKIVAIGLIKLVFLFFGSLIAPVYTFMFLNMLTVPTVIQIVKHLLASANLTESEAMQAVAVLDKVLVRAKSKELTRSQARKILMSMQKNIVVGIKISFIQTLRWIKNAPGRIGQWSKQKAWVKTGQGKYRPDDQHQPAKREQSAIEQPDSVDQQNKL